jgi:hypothetical protein
MWHGGGVVWCGVVWCGVVWCGVVEGALCNILCCTASTIGFEGKLACSNVECNGCASSPVILYARKHAHTLQAVIKARVDLMHLLHREKEALASLVNPAAAAGDVDAADNPAAAAGPPAIGVPPDGDEGDGSGGSGGIVPQMAALAGATAAVVPSAVGGGGGGSGEGAAGTTAESGLCPICLDVPEVSTAMQANAVVALQVTWQQQC